MGVRESACETERERERQKKEKMRERETEREIVYKENDVNVKLYTLLVILERTM